MSLESEFNPHVEPSVGQCEMIQVRQMSEGGYIDVQCLEPSVGTVPESCATRVCASCADSMKLEGFAVTYYDACTRSQRQAQVLSWAKAAFGVGQPVCSR